jgi:uracil-DNA glycosylase
MEVQIEPSWKAILKEEFEKPYFERLTTTVREAYRGGEPIYPPPQLIFNAFALCPFDSVRVVILGQDPYHGAGQAHGLCFSVQDGVKIPPSLQNVYKEIRDDLDMSAHITKPLESGNLEKWAKQGVLLLNATLTVAAGKPNSHQGLGWETFTDAVIQKISDERNHVVFLLWGAYAQKKGVIIDRKKHLVLEAPHPSPFSAHSGFFGCKHFSKTNTYLEKHVKKPIVW